MSAMFWRWGFWFRPLRRGRGIHIARDSMKLFSERHGYRKVYRLGRWSLKFLPPLNNL